MGVITTVVVRGRGVVAMHGLMVARLMVTRLMVTRLGLMVTRLGLVVTWLGLVVTRPVLVVTRLLMAIAPMGRLIVVAVVIVVSVVVLIIVLFVKLYEMSSIVAVAQMFIVTIDQRHNSRLVVKVVGEDHCEKTYTLWWWWWMEKCNLQGSCKKNFNCIT